MSAAAEPKTTPAPSAERAPSASPVDAHSSPVAETRQSSGKATAAMVLGVIGVLGAFLIPIVGLILGVIAIVFGRQAKADTAERPQVGPRPGAGRLRARHRRRRRGDHQHDRRGGDHRLVDLGGTAARG